METLLKIKKHKKLKIIAIIAAIFLVAIVTLGIIFIDNKNIDFENYEIISDYSFNRDIKVVHLSDLHFPKIEVDFDALTNRLIDEKPDMIAITGDLIDGGATVETCGVSGFIEKLKTLAPIFYVNGNHEVRNTKNSEKLYSLLRAHGVTVLDNESLNVEIEKTQITVIGLSDDASYDKKYLANTLNAETNFKILLAHRPEKWDNYINQEKSVLPNLILTGHIHGGQFRFFGKGFLAPSQGFFPKYDAGEYKTDNKDSTMIISRGLGSSLFPFRFNNNPNVPIITIKSTQ